MGNLIKRLTARHAFFIAISALLLGGFEFLLCAVVSTVNVGGVLEDILKSVPPMFRSIIEEQFFGGLSAGGILAFGWNHPIAHATGAAVAIVLATRAVAGEIERGTLELVLSQPISRFRYFSGQVAFAACSIILLSLVGAGGTLLGQAVFKFEAFTLTSMIKLALNYVLLQSAWYGLTLLISVASREGGRVAATGFVLVLVSFLMQVIGKLWQAAAFLLPYSLHTYYSPQTVLVQDILEAKSVAVLLGVFVATVGAAAWRFQRRDIP